MRVIRLKEVAKRTGLSRSTIYQMLSESLFPQPIKIGERAIAFYEHEIDEWLANKPRVNAA